MAAAPHGAAANQDSIECTAQPEPTFTHIMQDDKKELVLQLVCALVSALVLAVWLAFICWLCRAFN